MRRFLFLFVLVPLAVVIVALSVANRHAVTFSFDPVTAAPALSFTAPLFVFLFAALALGIVIGGVATWFRQGHWRRQARLEHVEAARAREDAERMRDRAAQLAAALPPARDAA
ncbi:MAG TPA: LapA family protein [Bauldia sp.]|nr:LapA family protein [Bauldia sp.]